MVLRKVSMLRRLVLLLMFPMLRMFRLQLPHHVRLGGDQEIGRLLEPDANSRDAPPEPPMPDPQSKPWKGFMPGWVVRFWRTNKRSNG